MEKEEQGIREKKTKEGPTVSLIGDILFSLIGLFLLFADRYVDIIEFIGPLSFFLPIIGAIFAMKGYKFGDYYCIISGIVGIIIFIIYIILWLPGAGAWAGLVIGILSIGIFLPSIFVLYGGIKGVKEEKSGIASVEIEKKT